MGNSLETIGTTSVISGPYTIEIELSQSTFDFRLDFTMTDGDGNEITTEDAHFTRPIRENSSIHNALARIRGRQPHKTNVEKFVVQSIDDFIDSFNSICDFAFETRYKPIDKQECIAQVKPVSMWIECEDISIPEYRLPLSARHRSF